MIFMKHKRSLATVLFFTFTFATPLTYAEPGKPGGHRGGPPPEAFEACENLAEGDACSFSGRRGEEVKGSCEMPPREESLVCAPEGGPPGGRGRPPE